MVIIPSVTGQGCTIYHEDKIQFIQGTIKECCERIINFVSYIDNKGNRIQKVDNIIVNITGHGHYYSNELRKNDLEVINAKLYQFM